jgi:hypothetical protein
MAKKVRKPRSQSPRTYTQVNPAAPATPAAPRKPAQTQTAPASPAAARKAVAASPARSATVNWEEEYHYVYADLRRTFILAGALLLLLIALNVAFRLM